MYRFFLALAMSVLASIACTEEVKLGQAYTIMGDACVAWNAVGSCAETIPVRCSGDWSWATCYRTNTPTYEVERLRHVFMSWSPHTIQNTLQLSTTRLAVDEPFHLTGDACIAWSAIAECAETRAMECTGNGGLSDINSRCWFTN